MNTRLINLNTKLAAEEVDAVLITKVPNVTYFSGFRGAPRLLSAKMSAS